MEDEGLCVCLWNSSSSNNNNNNKKKARQVGDCWMQVLILQVGWDGAPCDKEFSARNVSFHVAVSGSE